MTEKYRHPIVTGLPNKIQRGMLTSQQCNGDIGIE